VGSLILISPIGFPVVLLIARRLGQNRDSQNWDITIEVGNGRGEAIQGLHSDKRDVRFQEDKTRQAILTRSPYRVSFHPDMVGAHLFVSRLAGGVFKHFF
jgi:hypothetical protein